MSTVLVYAWDWRFDYRKENQLRTIAFIFLDELSRNFVDHKCIFDDWSEKLCDVESYVERIINLWQMVFTYCMDLARWNIFIRANLSFSCNNS